MNNNDDLIKIGKEYFPVFYKIGNRYRISKRIKGTHAEDVIKREIHWRKLQKILEHAVANGAKEPRQSMSSKSVYFVFRKIPHRISDHYVDFKGIQFVVLFWDTDIQAHLEYFNSRAKITNG